MAKGLGEIIADAIFNKFFGPEWIGARGEKLTERELKLVRRFGRDGKILRNVYIPVKNGETTEIDVMYITAKGIFVIESKNYSGWIFGNAADRNWTVVQKGGRKDRFFNPIMQNKGHIKWLSKLVGEDVPLHSIVAFSERCELKKVTLDDSAVSVIKRDSLYATIRDIWNKCPDTLDEAQVDALYEQLSELANVEEAVKQKHVEDVKRKINGKSKKAPETKRENPAGEKRVNASRKHPSSEEATPPKSGDEHKPCEQKTETEAGAKTMNTSESLDSPALSLTCPRCGSELVLRTARKGKHAGQTFYGCSAFPKCRYTCEVEGRKSADNRA